MVPRGTVPPGSAAARAASAIRPWSMVLRSARLILCARTAPDELVQSPDADAPVPGRELSHRAGRACWSSASGSNGRSSAASSPGWARSRACTWTPSSHRISTSCWRAEPSMPSKRRSSTRSSPTRRSARRSSRSSSGVRTAACCTATKPALIGRRFPVERGPRGGARRQGPREGHRPQHAEPSVRDARVARPPHRDLRADPCRGDGQGAGRRRVLPDDRRARGRDARRPPAQLGRGGGHHVRDVLPVLRPRPARQPDDRHAAAGAA